MKLSDLIPLPLEREQAQDGEYTGPGDNPPGYAGEMYETNNVGHFDRETLEWSPVADCYNGHQAAAIVHACNCHDGLVQALKDLLNVIAADELIPESVSYMRQAREELAKAQVTPTPPPKEGAP